MEEPKMALRRASLLKLGGTTALAALMTFTFGVSQAVEQIPAPANNTANNVRDRNAKTLTPMNQGNSKRDLRITAEIRKRVMADEKLSTTAQNAKIITRGAVVTLRGPVATAEEKAKLQDAARKVRGVKRVDNKLEIVSK
jgi:hyperosmotically inducible periplasmic protein